VGVEGARAHGGRGVESEVLRFAASHHVVLVVEGERVRVGATETVFVPAGKAWRMGAESVWAKWYVFANGGGIGEVMIGVGMPYEWAVVPEVEDVKGWDRSKLAALEREALQLFSLGL